MWWTSWGGQLPSGEEPRGRAGGHLPTSLDRENKETGGQHPYWKRKSPRDKK